MRQTNVGLNVVVAVVVISGLVLHFTAFGRAELVFDEPIRFPAPINSSSAWDSTPVLSPNNLELYFTSNRSGWGTYRSERGIPSDPFGAPRMLLNINHASLSIDGLTVYGNGDPGPYGAADIYMATRSEVDAPWGPFSVLDSSVNTGQWERWASVSPDDLELYFTKTASYNSSLGDIWVTRRTDPSAPFAPAVKLPENINQGYTDAPSLSPDGLSLFFTSDGHGGFGNSDIFVAYREDNESPWGDPVNLGPTVNSAEFEWQPSMSADGRTFLFSRSPVVDARSDLWWTHVFAPGDPFTTARRPRAIYTLSDTDNGSAFDNLGDSANSKMLSPAAAVGERDTSDGDAIVRLVTKFDLPQMPEVARRLQRATLRLHLEEIAGTPMGPVSLFHSVDDNDLEKLPADYEDGSYADSLLDLVQPTDMGQQYYELDVTDLVLADYAADGEDPLSAFRLQVNEAVFVEDDQSHRYRFTMPGAGTNHPELVLTFIPEPSSAVFSVIGSLSLLAYCLRRSQPFRHADAPVHPTP